MEVKRTQLSRRQFLVGVGALLSVGACFKRGSLQTIRMAGLPYGDHSQASIGLARDLFKDEGIDLKYETIRIEQAVSLLQSGTYDVVSLNPGILLQAFNSAPDLKLFVYGSLFQGYALMAPPSSPARPYTDFLKETPDPLEAAAITIRQILGKRFTYPLEGGIEPFINLLLETGGLTRRDFTPVILDDALAVAIMKRGDADFQVGGAPSRIALQKAGFKPIISAIDIAKAASPSPDSKALRAVFPDGWAARADFITQKRDIVVRMARVAYRINTLINTDPSVAPIHMAYLSKVTGQVFTVEDAEIFYKQLDPFLTFEEQTRWFSDPSYPLYDNYITGAAIESFAQTGLYKDKRRPTVADITIAAEIYKEIFDSGGLAIRART